MSRATGEVSGHGYVDLGLSVMWATRNVGADAPSAYGDYFAWGETAPKTCYDDENCTTWEREVDEFQGDPLSDAARANWHAPWRMPTFGELVELREKCQWEWVSVDGVKGCKATGPNGNSIFLPAAGFMQMETLIGDGDTGYYWTATPDMGNTQYAYRFFCNRETQLSCGYFRRDGRSVRPVTDFGHTGRRETLSAPTGRINGHAYVDLGLSVKWAAYNLGAGFPTEFGDHFAWGETDTKLSYTTGNSTTSGRPLPAIAGDPLRDAARATLGGSWRLPTEREMMELVCLCEWQWTSVDWVEGYKVTGPNGNSIFLPAAGVRLIGPEPFRTGCRGFYWCATPAPDDAQSAAALGFDRDFFCTNFGPRFHGQSIRAVSE